MKGIHTIGDLYTGDVLMSYSDLVQKYDVGDKGHFWKYLQLRECLLTSYQQNPGKNPIAEYLELPKHKAAILYSMFSHLQSKDCKNLRTIWQIDLNKCEIEDDTLLKILSSSGRNIREARGKLTQYKILHRFY